MTCFADPAHFTLDFNWRDFFKVERRECFRFLDASTGRFLQQDPEPGKVQSPISVINRYIYAGNTPIVFTDRNGRIFGIDDIIYIAVGSLIMTSYENNLSGGNFLQQFASNFMKGVLSSIIFGGGFFDSQGIGNSFALSDLGQAAFKGALSGLIKVGSINYITTNGFSKDQQLALSIMAPIFGGLVYNESNSVSSIYGGYISSGDILNPINYSWYNLKVLIGSYLTGTTPQYIQNSSN